MKTLRRIFVRGFFFAVLVLPLALQAQTPEWIWHDNKGSAPADNEIRFFRKTFTVDAPVTKAVLTIASDDQAIVYLNGKQVADLYQGTSEANKTYQFSLDGTNLPAGIYVYRITAGEKVFNDRLILIK